MTLLLLPSYQKEYDEDTTPPSPPCPRPTYGPNPAIKLHRANHAHPRMKIFLWPNRSPSRPAGSTKVADVSPYAAENQAISPGPESANEALMMLAGTMLCARPASIMAWPRHIRSTKATSWAGEARIKGLFAGPSTGGPPGPDGGALPIPPFSRSIVLSLPLLPLLLLFWEDDDVMMLVVLVSGVILESDADMALDTLEAVLLWWRWR